MRQLVSLIMYINNIFFLILVIPLLNVTVIGLSNFRHYSINTYNPYSFQQTDSHNNESDKSQNEKNKNNKAESDSSNDEVGAESSKSDQNTSNSDSSESSSDKSNNESNEQAASETSKNVDKSQNKNEADEEKEETAESEGEKNKSTENVLNNVILNPSATNVDLTIKTVRNETSNSINSFKHVCTLVQELISIMPQPVKSAEIELYTKKIITSELYNECLKHLTTLEAFENDLDKFATQAQISLIYSHTG